MDSYPESLSGMQLRSGIPTPNMGVTGHHGTPVAMNTPSNASRAATPTTVDSSSPIVQHKVTKRDTLAGLAIRYNVSVGDIKRANGLLSDNALYARDTIHIPTGGVPLGEELQLIFAQVAAGIGRDPVLNADANLHPASAAAARVARIINNTDTSSFMPDDPGLPWWCRCGTCDEDENRVACRSRRFTDSEEERTDFELQEVLLPPESASGPTRMSANMTRRHARSNQEGGAEDQPGGGSSASAPGDSRPYGKPPRTRGLPPPPPGGPALQGEGIASVMRQITDFGKSLGDLSLVQRIKAAANQPALAAGPKGKSQSFASAAEGVLGSLKAGMRPASQRKSDSGSGMGSPMLPRSHGADAGNTSVQQRRREGGKTD